MIVFIVIHILIRLRIWLVSRSRSPTLFMASEIGILAFEAFIVIKMVKSKFLKVVVILILRIFESVIKIKALMLCPLNTFFKDLLL